MTTQVNSIVLPQCPTPSLLGLTCGFLLPTKIEKVQAKIKEEANSSSSGVTSEIIDYVVTRSKWARTGTYTGIALLALTVLCASLFSIPTPLVYAGFTVGLITTSCCGTRLYDSVIAMVILRHIITTGPKQENTSTMKKVACTIAGWSLQAVGHLATRAAVQWIWSAVFLV